MGAIRERIYKGIETNDSAMLQRQRRLVGKVHLS